MNGKDSSKKMLTIKVFNRPQHPDKDFEALQPFTDFIYIYIHTVH